MISVTLALGLSGLVVLANGAAGWYFWRARADIAGMMGTMVGMTLGMLGGLLAGCLVGAATDMFVSNLVGLAVGIGLGAGFGALGGLMGVLDGGMGGLMGGMMGAMLGVMVATSAIQVWVTVSVLVVLNAVGVGGLVLLLKQQRLSPSAVDPVCEMDVEIATAKFISTYQGQPVYFCAPGCKRLFDKNPEKYSSRLPPSEPA